MKFKLFVAVIATVLTTSFAAQAQKTIVDIAVGSKEHTTLVAGVTAADLVPTLQSAGPFTVFAPTNAAFAKLPAGTLETLLKPENKATLAKILTYHVIAGTFDAAAVVKAIQANGGSLSLTTVSGNKLVASIKQGKVTLTDEKGNSATVVVADLTATNGVIHVIDAVVLPK
ncbi:MAG: fasciclin domain-containing protein [Sediminibacterium sp.]|jgi:uncharacterized surface protein with fasciclin (FAS1) repeats